MQGDQDGSSRDTYPNEFENQSHTAGDRQRTVHVPRAGGLTRVTIVEDHALFAEALDVALTMQGHEVHRIAADVPDLSQERLLSLVLRTRPRVVLLDLQLGPTHAGLPLIGPLTETGAAVVVVTGNVDAAAWGEALLLGAQTVLPKSTPLNTIITTINHIQEGRAVLAREERERHIATFRAQWAHMQEIRVRLATLSAREREILNELMQGHQVREIAREFVVAEATVRSQVKSILAKLGVASQLAAVGLALRAQSTVSPPEHGADD